VTGAGGFVGTRLVAGFRAAGWEVVAAGRASGDVALDVTDAGEARRVMDSVRPHAVVNLAAIAHRKRERITAEDYDAVNHRGVRHLLDAAAEAGVERFVQFSSASVYGEEGRRAPVREDDPLRPVGAYAASKARAEEACRAAEGRMSVSILRFPAIYAPGWTLDVRKRAYVPGMTGRLLLELTGAAPRHSLCALEHAVAFALRAAEGHAAGTFNVADEPAYPQPEIVEVIAALDGVSRRLRVPAGVAVLPLAGARVIPGGVGRQVRSHGWKLLRGLVLDTGRAADAGFVPRRRLGDLLKGRA
jgi:nucleoside-diphosphate-sugar epimerase